MADMYNTLREKLNQHIDSEKGIMIRVNPFSVVKAVKWLRKRLAVWKARRIIKEIESPRE
jgi:hypothetical protein